MFKFPTFFILAGLMGLALAPMAQAGERPSAGLSSPATTAATPSVAASATTKPVQLLLPSDNFSFFAAQPATAASKTDIQFQAVAARRHHILQLHQMAGLTTLGLMALTDIVGQMDYNDLYVHQNHTANFMWPKRVLAYTTAAAFFTTAGLALSAPRGYEADSNNTITLLHKIAVSGATALMLYQIGDGFYTARRADAGNQNHLRIMARNHLITGYATTGLLVIGASVWIF